jgi:hypothetical protein
MRETVFEEQHPETFGRTTTLICMCETQSRDIEASGHFPLALLFRLPGICRDLKASGAVQRKLSGPYG